MTPDDDAVRQLVGDGASDGEVARALGVSRDVARRRRVALGLPSAGRAGRPRSPAGLRVHLVQTHVSDSELAEIGAAVGDGEVGPWVRDVLLDAARREPVVFDRRQLADVEDLPPDVRHCRRCSVLYRDPAPPEPPAHPALCDECDRRAPAERAKGWTGGERIDLSDEDEAALARAEAKREARALQGDAEK